MLQFVKNLYRYRELLATLTISGIRARYRQTIIGIGWAVVQPLALMLIVVLVFSKIARFPSEGVPYALFAYAGLLPWTLHATAINTAVSSLTANVSLLRKVYFPREVFIASAVLSALVDYLVAAIIFVGMLLYYRVVPGVNLVYLPLVLLIHLTLITGIALGGAIVNVAVRDVSRALPLLLQLWMLASPIVYPLSFVPEQYRLLYLLNPMAGIVDGYRRVMIHNMPPEPFALGLAALLSIIVFSAGYWLFHNGERTTSDVA